MRLAVVALLWLAGSEPAEARRPPEGRIEIIEIEVRAWRPGPGTGLIPGDRMVAASAAGPAGTDLVVRGSSPAGWHEAGWVRPGGRIVVSARAYLVEPGMVRLHTLTEYHDRPRPVAGSYAARSFRTDHVRLGEAVVFSTGGSGDRREPDFPEATVSVTVRRLDRPSRPPAEALRPPGSR